MYDNQYYTWVASQTHTADMGLRQLLENPNNFQEIVSHPNLTARIGDYSSAITRIAEPPKQSKSKKLLLLEE